MLVLKQSAYEIMVMGKFESDILLGGHIKASRRRLRRVVRQYHGLFQRSHVA